MKEQRKGKIYQNFIPVLFCSMKNVGIKEHTGYIVGELNHADNSTYCNVHRSAIIYTPDGFRYAAGGHYKTVLRQMAKNEQSHKKYFTQIGSKVHHSEVIDRQELRAIIENEHLIEII